MSGHFAASARRLAGLAGALFGWRPEEFWNATPAELAAVLGAWGGAGAGCEAGGGEPLRAADLQRLREKFPDG